MYISARRAMRKRRMIESPSCAVSVMQQPDLGRLGRLTGPASLTLGDMNFPSVSSVTSSISPWMLALIAIGGGLLWWKAPRGTGKKIAGALTLAGAAAGGYVLAKHWS